MSVVLRLCFEHIYTHTCLCERTWWEAELSDQYSFQAMPRVKLIDKRSSHSQPFLRDSPPSSVPGHGWKGMINLSAAPLLFSVSHTGLPLSSLSFLLSLSLCPCSFSRSISSHPLPDSLRLSFYLSHLHFVHFQSLVGWHACFFLAHVPYMHMTDGRHLRKCVLLVSSSKASLSTLSVLDSVLVQKPKYLCSNTVMGSSLSDYNRLF